MFEAVLSVNLKQSWISALTSTLPVEVHLLDTIAHEEEGVEDLVEVKLNNIPLVQVKELIESMESVDHLKSSEMEHGRAILIVSTRDCGGCRALVESNCFLISATAGKGGWVEWKMIIDEKKQLKKLVENLEGRGVDTELKQITAIEEKETLTDRQKTILKKALERGYFEFPKRIGIRELAKMFGISTASVSETLRRGQKKIIESYFNSDSHF